MYYMDYSRVSIFTRCIEKGLFGRSENPYSSEPVATEQHCQLCLKDRGIYIYILNPVTGL